MTSLAKDTLDKITVMQAFADGALIEFKTDAVNEWTKATNPIWDWGTYQYRVKPIKPINPDWVDWDAIATRFKYMARDEDDHIFLYEEEPRITDDQSDVWSGHGAIRIDSFYLCYAAGDAPWKQSLVVRPKQKSEV